MVREREHRGEIQASTLPGGDFDLFCIRLYGEGLVYNLLKKRTKEVKAVGKHTSIHAS